MEVLNLKLIESLDYEHLNVKSNKLHDPFHFSPTTPNLRI